MSCFIKILSSKEGQSEGGNGDEGIWAGMVFIVMQEDQRGVTERAYGVNLGLGLGLGLRHHLRHERNTNGFNSYTDDPSSSISSFERAEPIYVQSTLALPLDAWSHALYFILLLSRYFSFGTETTTRLRVHSVAFREG